MAYGKDTGRVERGYYHTATQKKDVSATAIIGEG